MQQIHTAEGGEPFAWLEAAVQPGTLSPVPVWPPPPGLALVAAARHATDDSLPQEVYLLEVEDDVADLVSRRPFHRLLYGYVPRRQLGL